MPELTKSAAPSNGNLALAVTWEAKDGESEAVADILRRMAESVKAEPGTLVFWVHRSTQNEKMFFLYELYADEAALEAHQQTEWFKTLILGQALPKLTRRERVYLTPFKA
jgi:quinol monooxygenase YgiN